MLGLVLCILTGKMGGLRVAQGIDSIVATFSFGT